MQFDAALAAQDTFQRAEAELGSDWDTAVELEGTFPPTLDRQPARPIKAYSLSLHVTPWPIPSRPSASSSPGSR